MPRLASSDNLTDTNAVEGSQNADDDANGSLIDQLRSEQVDAPVAAERAAVQLAITAHSSLLGILDSLLPAVRPSAAAVKQLLSSNIATSDDWNALLIDAARRGQPTDVGRALQLAKVGSIPASMRQRFTFLSTASRIRDIRRSAVRNRRVPASACALGDGDLAG